VSTNLNRRYNNEYTLYMICMDVGEKEVFI